MKHEAIIKQLTLGQKAALMSGKNTWETQEIIGLIPSMFLADGPHGVRKQVGASDHLGLNESIPATCFPPAATLANSWDENLLTQVGECIGQEAKASDVQVILGPGLNTKRHPKCGRNFEYYSEDPYLAGKLAAASIRGIQSTGTIACPKHFAVNSQENRRMASDSIVDERAYRELYTTNFEIAIKEGQAKSIMSAYNLINGIYANENKELLQDILRDEFGFDGFVVSDWGGDNNHVEGVRNGSHLAMPGQSVNGPLEIVEAVRNGELPETILDKRVDELIDVILHSTASQENTQSFDWSTHHQLAQEAAMRSIVLLKNENQVLPVNHTQKVAIIGEFAEKPRYQGAGSSVVNPKQLETTLEVIDRYPIELTGYAQGYRRGGVIDTQLEVQALALADKSEVVFLYVGLDEIFESEGMDRQTLAMPKNQQQLIEKLAQTSAKIVVVLSAGSVIEMPWADKVDGIIHGYLSGEAGASAMLEVLTGNYNPSGKLNESYPMKEDDILFGESFPAEGKYAYYQESIFVGYRYYDSANKAVRYPFGYGLSYTTFAYDALEVTSEGIRVTVTNTGDSAGEEVVQLYVGKKESRLIRAARELKGFKKVHLAPKESRVVTIPFDDKTFRYYDVTTKKWAIEAGTYQIAVGSHSRNLPLSHELSIEGTIPEGQPIRHYKNYEFDQLTMNDFEKLYGRRLPSEKQEKIHQLDNNSVISELKYAKNPVARFVYHRLNHMLEKSEAKGTPNLNLLFIYNMPFRAIAKMTNGMVSMKMVDNILLIVNGHFFVGFGGLMKAYFKNAKVKKMNILEQE